MALENSSLVLRGDQHEIFFSYGYDKSKSQILYSYSKNQIPDAFVSTAFRRRVEFFDKEYSWSLRNYQEGTYSTMTVDKIIDRDKIFVGHNPKLFDPEFIKRHPHCF